MKPTYPSSLVGDLRSGRLPVLDLVADLEDRFREKESTVHAFVADTVDFERIWEEGGELARRYPNPEQRPPLYGLPVGVKDIFHVDGFPTTGGSRLPPELLAGPEGSAVRRLRQAGALILGKTVTTEFAYFAPGSTTNPWNARHTPGGSSSGSAAAVAAGLCPLALGTQTIASIIRPAAYCGVIGFKPSYDRIPRDGILELASSFDHVGTFTRSLAAAEDAAAALCDDWQPVPTLLRPILVLPEGPLLARAEDAARQHLDAIVRRLEERGFRILRLPVLDDLDAVVARHELVLAAQAARFHGPWFERLSHLYQPRTAKLLRDGLAVSDDQLAAALEECKEFRQGLVAALEGAGGDLWLLPAATGPAPEGLHSTGDPILSLPWSQAGLPSLTLPAGQAQNRLPLGIQLVAGPGSDERLFAWARALQGELP
jgi:Asp-tRNA(Asn)/Glu-tRNA(Gln) amidotransferase A subunit family amidase